jgi:prepilin-type N-terminal cleavage/methylation domain-containing protein
MSERRRGGDSGFTMVELLVAISILSVVMALVFSALNGGVRQAADAQSRVQIEADVRTVADAFVRDLRQAYTGDPSLDRIASMTANTITFYSPDRSTPYHLRKISYRLSGTDFQRSITISSDTDGFPWVFGATSAYATQLQYVRNTTTFAYRDAGGNVTTDPTAVSVVDLILTVDRDTTKTPAAYTSTTTVQIRGT